MLRKIGYLIQRRGTQYSNESFYIDSGEAITHRDASNEQEAIAISRLMHSNGNESFDALAVFANAYKKDTTEAILKSVPDNSDYEHYHGLLHINDD